MFEILDAIDDRDTRAVTALNDLPCPFGECEYELEAHAGLDRCPDEWQARAAYGDR